VLWSLLSCKYLRYRERFYPAAASVERLSSGDFRHVSGVSQRSGSAVVVVQLRLIVYAIFKAFGVI
jgi:hypothetical protein